MPFYEALEAPAQAVLADNGRSHQGYRLSGRTPAQVEMLSISPRSLF
jgi:hypothetical protein